MWGQTPTTPGMGRQKQVEKRKEKKKRIKREFFEHDIQQKGKFSNAADKIS